jgi:hypothetical protein
VLINAAHTTFEDAEETFNRLRVKIGPVPETFSSAL